MNQLTRLTTNDLSRAVVITDSLIIADEFSKQHSKVLRSIRDLIFQIEEMSQAENGFPNNYHVKQVEYEDRGKLYPCFEMNFDFYMLLVMGFTGKKALKVKTQFINSFNFMSHELIARGETRKVGISIRKDLTKAIIDYVPDTGNFKKFAISNYTGLVYKKVLGMRLKKYKELHNIPKGQKNRDFLNKEQLEQVQYYESKIADIIEVSSDLIDEKELFQNIKKFVNK